MSFLQYNYGNYTPGGSLQYGKSYQPVVDPDVTAQIKGQKEIAQIPIDWQREKFGTLFPWLQQQMGSFGGASSVGGSSGRSPEITVGGVFNPQQIGQQVNAARSSNDQAAAGQMQRQAQDVAGRGFGSNSPLLQALYGQTQASNLATNTANEREIRMGAAQQNATQLLDSQKARESQFANRQREDIERRKVSNAYFNSLLSAIGGL